MSADQVRVTFQPHGRSVFVLPGTKLLEAAGRVGLTVETPCGGSGTCGKCRVRITSGASPPAQADGNAFSDEELAAGWRLACQTAVCSAAVVFVPQESLFAARHQILAEAQDGAVPEVLPAVRKIFVELPAPTPDDNEPVLVRLERRIGPVKTDLAMVRRLSVLLSKGQLKGTAVITDHHLLDFEPGDTSAECYGAAFDVGTTTVVGSLLALCTGEELAIASAVNPQTSFGDDVLSRIQYASGSQAKLAELHEAIVGVVDELIGRMCSEAAVARRRIYQVSLAGNTTMEHLLCGVDVSSLGAVPFVPVHGRGLTLAAGHVGVQLHHRAAAYVFPVIGGFVGGDTVAGMLATRLAERDGPVMMVDIGTNGEIVVAHDGKLLAASTAAGPAFEGARISCGMRATSGAIEKVVFDGDVRSNIIGNVEPVGLCGSGLIDLAAELLEAGIVSPEGRLRPPDELPASLPDPLRRRVRLNDRAQTEFVIAGASSDGARITLTQRDVRELQLATGAIRAGIGILLGRAGIGTADLERVLIAGGFGSFIRRSMAQRIGLLPADLGHDRISYVGNASLNGAKWALLSTRAHEKAEEIARRTRHVELSEDPQFQAKFAEAMIFPA